MREALQSLLLSLQLGGLAGLLFGLLIISVLRHNARRLVSPPSPTGQVMATALTLIFCGLFVGPLFSFAYRHLFWRAFGADAWWVFGCLHTLILGVAMSLYAWRLNVRDLRLIVAMNTGAALVLGWLIPLLHHLFR